MIETSYILPINNMKEFPSLSHLDQSLKESYTTANNGQDEEEQKNQPEPAPKDKEMISPQKIEDLSGGVDGKKSSTEEELMQDSMINLIKQSSYKLATNTDEIEVTNKTPGKEMLPLNKDSVGL